jgi:hypothetical protein
MFQNQYKSSLGLGNKNEVEKFLKISFELNLLKVYLEKGQITKKVKRRGGYA